MYRVLNFTFSLKNAHKLARRFNFIDYMSVSHSNCILRFTCHWIEALTQSCQNKPACINVRDKHSSFMCSICLGSNLAHKHWSRLKRLSVSRHFMLTRLIFLYNWVFLENEVDTFKSNSKLIYLWHENNNYTVIIKKGIKKGWLNIKYRRSFEKSCLGHRTIKQEDGS